MLNDKTISIGETQLDGFVQQNGFVQFFISQILIIFLIYGKISKTINTEKYNDFYKREIRVKGDA